MTTNNLDLQGFRILKISVIKKVIEYKIILSGMSEDLKDETKKLSKEQETIKNDQAYWRKNI